MMRQFTPSISSIQSNKQKSKRLQALQEKRERFIENLPNFVFLTSFEPDDMDIVTTEFVDSGLIFKKFTEVYKKANLLFQRPSVEILNRQGIDSDLRDVYHAEMSTLTTAYNNRAVHTFIIPPHIVTQVMITAQNDIVGDGIENVIARHVVSLKDCDDIKHGPESEFIMFVFGLLKQINTDFSNPVYIDMFFHNLRNAMFVRLEQARNRNDTGHRIWSMKMFFLLDLIKYTNVSIPLALQSQRLFDDLYKGYGWLSMGSP